jgi:hypothetical protein
LISKVGLVGSGLFDPGKNRPDPQLWFLQKKVL